MKNDKREHGGEREEDLESGWELQLNILLHRVQDGGQANQKDAEQKTKTFYKNISCCCTS